MRRPLKVLILVCGQLLFQQIAAAAFPAPTGAQRAELYRQIADLRQRCKAGTLERSTTADDVHLCQDWLDLLEDEGCIHPAAVVGTPLEMFDAMDAANKQLATHSDQLGATVNALVGRLDRLCNFWYADGTVGDISPRWITLKQWSVKSQSSQQVVLSTADATGAPFDLTITAFTGGIFRVHGPEEGFFKPHSLTAAPLTVKQAGDGLSIDSGDASMRVALNPLHISVVRGQDVLWEASAIELLPAEAGKTGIAAVREQAVLSDADHCFGLGERFDRFDHRGRVVSNWTTDSIFSSVRSKWTESYKPVPLVIDPRGVSTFFNTQTLARIDCGATERALEDFVAPGPVLDDYLFVGTPMQAIRGYTRLTGKPIAVPDWALLPWMGGGVARWNIHGADRSVDEVRAAVERMHSLDIPHSAIYIEGLPTDKPNGKALVSWLLNDQHLRPLAWYGPNAATDETDSFLPDQLAHLFVHEPDGKNFIVPTGRFLAGCYYIDFTNPLSVEMLIRRWKWHLDEGIRGCMIDGGEDSPRDGVFDNGMSGQAMHNLYPLFYHKAHQALFDELLPNDNILFGRSGCPGDQSSMGQFPGDMPGDFSGLTGAIHAGLTAASSGFSIWGSDVGGYWSRDGKPPAKDVYIRWFQFATFSPLTRVHGEKSPREPWNWDDETVAIYKYFDWLKYNLQPYLIDTAAAGHESGEPMMRPVPLVYADDVRALTADDEYLFGPDVLVAPLHSGGNGRSVYLPGGTWYELLNNMKVVQGGQMLRPIVPLAKMPLYGRGGGIIPLHLNAHWQLGQSMSSGSVPVTLLLPEISGPSSSEHGLTLSRDGDDLLLSANDDLMRWFWIPSKTADRVAVGDSSLMSVNEIPATAVQGACYFDAANHRLRIQARLVPGSPLRVHGYFAEANASDSSTAAAKQP